MKKLTIILTLQFIIILSSFGKSKFNSNTINKVIGDISYIEKFKTKPTKLTDEKLRIKTHLAYVENILKNKSNKNLSKKQLRNRTKIISLLHEYYENGVFPSNYDYSQNRRPCFIDKNGNICAVGYLIEKTVSRKFSEEINSKYQYHYIKDMNDKRILNWAYTNGLTIEECAMIQPGYTYNVQKENSSSYEISSIVFTGFNSSQLVYSFTNKKINPRLIYGIGIFSGSVQTAFGIINYKSNESVTYGGGISYTYNYDYQNQRNLSYFNIGMGSITVINNALKLLLCKNESPKLSDWNLQQFESIRNEQGIAFNYTTKF